MLAGISVVGVPESKGHDGRAQQGPAHGGSARRTVLARIGGKSAKWLLSGDGYPVWMRWRIEVEAVTVLDGDLEVDLDEVSARKSLVNSGWV